MNATLEKMRLARPIQRLEHLRQLSLSEHPRHETFLQKVNLYRHSCRMVSKDTSQTHLITRKHTIGFRLELSLVPAIEDSTATRSFVALGAKPGPPGPLCSRDALPACWFQASTPKLATALGKDRCRPGAEIVTAMAREGTVGRPRWGDLSLQEPTVPHLIEYCLYSISMTNSSKMRSAGLGEGLQQEPPRTCSGSLP